MKTIVAVPVQLPDSPDTYQVTVTGFDVDRHRRLAAAAFRSFAQENGIGRGSLVSSYGTYEDFHGVSHFNFRVIGGPPSPSEE